MRARLRVGETAGDRGCAPSISWVMFRLLSGRSNPAKCRLGLAPAMSVAS